MFFTSCIIIAFFCFAFYLIWHQFLKKDTRLSTGLQVLRKKTGDLENLSLTVDTQVDRQIQTLNEKSQNLESLLQHGRELCKRLEKNIEIARAIQDSDDFSSVNPRPQSPPRRPPVTAVVEEGKPPAGKKNQLLLCEEKKTSLKTVKEEREFRFGESPFTNMDFTDSP